MPPQDLTTPVQLPAVSQAAPPDTRLDDLPTDLEALGRMVRYHEGQALLHAFESGRILLRAKQQVPHGGWLPWLDEHFPLSRAIASQRMALVDWIGDRQELLKLLGDLSLRQVRTLMALPEADLQELLTDGTIGGLPIAAVAALPHRELQRQVEAAKAREEKALAGQKAALEELEAARKALAERAIEAKRGNAAAKWIAKIDAVKETLEKALVLHFDALLDECEGNLDNLPPAAQAHLLGLIQYIESRTRLEALSFARALGERPGASPQDRVPMSAIVDVVTAPRAAKQAFPLPEGRIPAAIGPALERDGLSLAQVNPGGLTASTAQPEPVRDLTHVMRDGRVISIPKGSALGAEIPAWLEGIEKGLHGPAVETYQLHVNTSAAKARLAVKQVAEALVKGRRSMPAPAPAMAPANRPMTDEDQGDF